MSIYQNRLIVRLYPIMVLSLLKDCTIESLIILQ